MTQAKANERRDLRFNGRVYTYGLCGSNLRCLVAHPPKDEGNVSRLKSPMAVLFFFSYAIGSQFQGYSKNIESNGNEQL